MGVVTRMAVAVGCVLALAGSAAVAAPAGQAQARMGAPAEPAGCEKAVKDYVNALRFIKEASGNGIAGRVEQAYLNEAQVEHIASQQGYCAAAQALRNRGAAVR